MVNNFLCLHRGSTRNLLAEVSMAHRVSGVLKSNGCRGLTNYGALTSFSKNHRHEAPVALHSHWERPRSLWLAICIFLFLFAVCLFILPASMEVPTQNLGPGSEASLRNSLQGLSFGQASNPFNENTEGEKSNTEWQLKPDHFTLFNVSSFDSTPFNPLNLTNGVMRVYVYDLPAKFNEDWLVDERCSSHLFAAEVAIHKILLKSPIRTLDPYEADFFFMPVYVSCKFSPKTGFPWLGHASKLMQAAVKYVSTKMEFWNRNSGRDHIFVAAHDYGACFHTLESQAIAHGIPEFMQNSLILQTFGVEGFHPCQTAEHIQIPPYISPSVAASYIQDPPERQQRSIFAFFRGKMEINPKNVSGLVYSRGTRTVLYKRFSRNKRLFYLKRQRAANYQQELLRSTFCLCPLGWAPWSPRIVEAVTYGCVPVIIADNITLPYSHVIDWGNISLSVREHDVPKLDKILLNVADTNLTAIQRNLWTEENRRALLFTDPLVKGDASWQILDRLSTKLDRSYIKHSSAHR